jgi:NAD(P)-dependent dehydrogenase (short-subunit alcohol dehydrogenase family)
MEQTMLRGKVALITGAGGEIGRAAALLFSREGARVIVSDISAEAAEQTATLINESGGSAIAIACDIADRTSVDALIAGAISHFGRLDCAFNNAGINLKEDVDWDIEAFERSMSVNTLGTMYCLTAEVNAMRRSGGGSIVNNASVMGLVGSTKQPGYAASKHAVVGLTKTAALCWAGEKIRVNAVCPGAVRTVMTEASMSISPQIRARLMSMSPIGRLAEASEIAEAALWLCSERSSFVNGVALAVDGGFTAG